MSETSKNRTATPIQRIGLYIVIIIGIILLLVLGYLGGSFIIPGSIKSAYQNKNCESVIKLDGIYTSIYPTSMADKNIASLVRECAVYTLAVANEQKKAWRDSYNAFNVYSETYPNGLFVNEAHEHGAVSLIGLIKDEIDKKKYVEAVGNLNLVLGKYKNTKVTADAASLVPEVYTAWGTDLRETSDFEGAERTFNDFKTWAERNQEIEQAKTAQNEIANTYLAWGLAFQSQKHFEDAKMKLDLAASTDPNPLADAGPASQVKTNQAKFYGEWGDYLVEQKEFSRAIEQYKLSASLSENADLSTALDGIANGYIQWAKDLSTKEDFLGALKQMDLAQENATSDATKKLVEDARLGIYLAFSNSSGEQAQQAMQDALRKVCELGEKPDLPIFALDKKNILAGIYGVDIKLPEKVAATTPGGMHYVACVEVVEETVQFVDFYGFQMSRIKVSWNVNLHDVETGSLIETHRLEGEAPPALPTDGGEIAAGGKRQKYAGKPPDIVNLVDWLLTMMK